MDRVNFSLDTQALPYHLQGMKNRIVKMLLARGRVWPFWCVECDKETWTASRSPWTCSRCGAENPGLPPDGCEAEKGLTAGTGFVILSE